MIKVYEDIRSGKKTHEKILLAAAYFLQIKSRKRRMFQSSIDNEAKFSLVSKTLSLHDVIISIKCHAVKKYSKQKNAIYIKFASY